jgi:hypothetical protein
VDGELRLEDLDLRTAGGVDVGRLRAAQVVDVQLTVREDLGVAQDDPLSRRRTVNGQPDATDQVLSKVDDEPAGSPRANGDRREVAGDAYRVVGFGHQRTGVGVKHRDRAEAAVRTTGRVPAGHVQPGVDVLAHEQVGDPDRAGLLGPARVSGHNLTGAVGEVDHELGEKRRGVAVVMGGLAWVKADIAAPPAVGYHRREDVAALAHHAGDVVRLVLQPAVILRPTRRQLGIADPFTVEPRLVHATSGRVQPRAHRWSVHSERSAQVQRGRQETGRRVEGWVARRDGRPEAVRVAPDPHRGPVVAVEQAGLEPAPGRAGRRAGLVPDLDPPEVPGGRTERRAVPRHEQPVAGLAPAAVPQPTGRVVDVTGPVGGRDAVGALRGAPPVAG